MSTLLEQASLIMIPSGYAEDIVYSVIPETGAGDLSFTRASNGTRVNSAGLVEVVPWNLLENSEQFTSANGWGASVTGGSTASQTSDYGVAPNGTTTADRIQVALNGQPYADWVYVSSPSVIVGQTYTYSVYIKSLSGTKTIKFFSEASNNVPKTITTEWVRYDYTWTATATAIYPRFLLDSGTSISADILAWGYQLNIGSTAKPYFPTTDRLNVPRLTYQNGGGGCPSLLLEKQSTNLLTWSEEFDNASWTKAGSSVTANATTSPDGTQNADRIVENNLSGFHYVLQLVGSAGTYTLSVYAKADTRNWIYLTTFDGVADRGAFFNVSTGVVGNIDTGVTASIESVGNGWYRCIVTATPVANFSSSIQLATANGTRNYTGNGTSGLYIWGAQLE